MGRKKRGSNSDAADGDAKKSKVDSFLVKKYRPGMHYKSMDQFLKYTKQHKMLDAAYTLHEHGGTVDKPIVFKVMVGGQPMGYGRGRDRDQAIENAIRSTFALFQAHGYDMELNDDCMLTAPTESIPAPPPPLPSELPPGMPPPLPPGMPPIPGAGFPPPPPPEVPPIAPAIIPQPQQLSASLSTPSTIQQASIVNKPVSLSMNKSVDEDKKKNKGGKLVFDGENDECMEERRAMSSRYRSLVAATM